MGETDTIAISLARAAVICKWIARQSIACKWLAAG
jgi:hypothetical protein